MSRPLQFDNVLFRWTKAFFTRTNVEHILQIMLIISDKAIDFQNLHLSAVVPSIHQRLLGNWLPWPQQLKAIRGHELIVTTWTCILHYSRNVETEVARCSEVAGGWVAVPGGMFQNELSFSFSFLFVFVCSGGVSFPHIEEEYVQLGTSIWGSVKIWWLMAGVTL